jgi:hypothetical protein
MTREQYFSRQRALAKSQARAEYRQAVLIRRAHREFYAPLITAVSKGENPEIDKQALAQRIEAIIRAESIKPAEEAATLQAEMEASLLGGMGIKPTQIRNNNPGQTAKNDSEWRKGQQSFKPVKVTGQGWSVKASPKQGISAYRRDPETGKIIWDTTPLTWLFAKRYDLSTSVWKAVAEEEQSIFSIVRTGRALGRDVKDIAKDLETYIDYGDGGKRVMARWNHMFPNTDKGRQEAWKRQYLRDTVDPETRKTYQELIDEAQAEINDQDGLKKLEFAEESARKALRTPEAKAYVKEQMALKTRIGTPLRPDVVKEYHGRLGVAGIDYRTMRIMRTETAAVLNDRQADIARNSYICTGEVDWVLQKGRDGFNCECAAHAAGGPYDVDHLPGPIPLHPNCNCQLRPHLKTREQIEAEFKLSTAADDEIIKQWREQG